MKRNRYTMKDMQAALAAYNARTGDTLEVYAAYGAYKVVRVITPGGATRDLSGLQQTPREAMQAAGLSLYY